MGSPFDEDGLRKFSLRDDAETTGLVTRGYLTGVRALVIAASCCLFGCFLVAEDEPVNPEVDTKLGDAKAPGADDASSPPVDASVASDVAIIVADADVTSAACEAVGGTCALGRWAQCPPGTQPAEGDIHRGCGQPRGNFCCVPLPPSASATCAEAQGPYDCFPTVDCHPCFSVASDPSLSCPTGRTCCAYTCPD